MKIYKTSRNIIPPFLNSGSRWKLLVNFKPATLPSGKKPVAYYMKGRAGPKAGLYGLGEEKNHLYLPGFEPRTVQAVANRYTD
jgi:hypothetical protein